MWWRDPAIKQSLSPCSEEVFFTLTAEKPKTHVLFSKKNGRSIELSHLLSSPTYTEGKFVCTCMPYMTFEYPNPVGLDQVIEDFSEIEEFLSLLFGQNLQIRFAAVSQPKNEVDPESQVYGDISIIFSSKPDKSNFNSVLDVFLTADHIGEQFSHCWNEWIERRESLRSVVQSLITAGFDSELDDDTRLISSISALERLYELLGFWWCNVFSVNSAMVR